MFVPVRPTKSSEHSLAPGTTQMLALPAMQTLTQATPANGHFGAKAAHGVPLNTPMDILPCNDTYSDVPLDLSKKSNPSQSNTVATIPVPSVKMEPMEVEVSGKMNGAETPDCPNQIVET